MQAERIESMSEKNETVLRKTPLFANLTDIEMGALEITAPNTRLTRLQVKKCPPDSGEIVAIHNSTSSGDRYDPPRRPDLI